MDVRISKTGQNFKFRVGAIIKKNGKFLTCKINKNFYCLVGGHVQLNEDTETALIREVKEELCVDVKIVALSCIFENFFTIKSGRKYHELCFAYEVEIPKDYEMRDFARDEIDNGENVRLEFKWLTLDEMRECFKPRALVDVLEADTFAHLIIRQQKQ